MSSDYITKSNLVEASAFSSRPPSYRGGLNEEYELEVHITQHVSIEKSTRQMNSYEMELHNTYIKMIKNVNLVELE